MIILDTVLFVMLAGAITLKVALLAAAAVLLVNGLTARIRQLEVVPAAVAVKTSRTGCTRLTVAGAQTAHHKWHSHAK